MIGATDVASANTICSCTVLTLPQLAASCSVEEEQAIIKRISGTYKAHPSKQLTGEEVMSFRCPEEPRSGALGQAFSVGSAAVGTGWASCFLSQLSAGNYLSPRLG